ncbi:class 3-domain-containing protein [Pelagophyceae sp. CCMP2097]|nr:class 3-domain-containing protein [Pelagophyceae sp. CCMP2097]
MAPSKTADEAGAAAPVVIDCESIRYMSLLMQSVYRDPMDLGIGTFVKLCEECDWRPDRPDLLSPKEREDLRVLLTRGQELFPAGDEVCPRKKQLTVVFRGTDSRRDILQGLFVATKEIKKDDIVGTSVHRGFFKQLHCQGTFGKLKRLLREQLEALPDWGVSVAGHSLGEALSTLASYELTLAFPETEFIVYAFASPKVGDTEFKKTYNAQGNVRQYRIYHARDTFTSVPTFGWYHVGDNLRYDKAKKNAYYFWKYWNPWDHKTQRYVDAVAKGFQKAEGGEDPTVCQRGWRPPWLLNEKLQRRGGALGCERDAGPKAKRA